MKKYFIKDHSLQEDFSDMQRALKKSYDDSDDTFENRFDGLDEKKPDRLKKIIDEVIERCGQKGTGDSKLESLVLGNAYLRLAQCQNEMFKKSQEYYREALRYLKEPADYSNLDEIDVLLMLNKGKYFRNTAEVGKKSDYERALSIFRDVEKSIRNIEVSDEKKFHLLLDAKINIGRVSRYSYDFDGAKDIFLPLICAIQKYVSDETKKKLWDCKFLMSLLCDVKSDQEVEKYGQNVKMTDVLEYAQEYLQQSLIHIGIMYRKEANYGDARKIFQLIDDIDKEKNIDAQNNLGVCHRKLGKQYGCTTPEGKEEYERAKKIFSELHEKGNKFALINLYKCQLDLAHTEGECRKVIDELCEDEGLDNSFHLQFILGKFYFKIRKYDKACDCFERIYKKRSHIARGSIGFKAYYNLAQCKICIGDFNRACVALSGIREMLKKNHNHIDLLTEIDYGWCLMQKGSYRKALDTYQALLVPGLAENIRKKQQLEINNNIAECYIHLGFKEKAEEHIQNVLEIESQNKKALYLKGLLLLTWLSKEKGEAFDYQNVYTLFDGLAGKESIEKGLSAGWLISAVLLYDQTHNQKVEEKIIKKIKYSLDAISMKSFFYLAGFILEQQETGKWTSPNDTLYRDFCHIKLFDCGENQTFQYFMESLDFHYFQKEDRAFILAHIVRMYKYIFDIKVSCRITYDESGNMASLPYHYTKLNTLNHLLIKQGGQEPRLRLWNSAYMNDAYEGKVFDKLLGRALEGDDVAEKYTGSLANSKMQADSNVYITSFSTAENSFQMWSIYGDNEKGAAIRFDEDFFDVKHPYQDMILDDDADEYALYKVKYLDINDTQEDKDLMNTLRGIGEHLRAVEERLNRLRPDSDSAEYPFFVNAEAEVRAFISSRLDEVRFLFKSKSYEYENELRLIRGSHDSNIDDKNFPIPRLYINVERAIDDIDVKLGGKLENQQKKDLFVWLRSTGRVKSVEFSDLGDMSDKVCK